MKAKDLRDYILRHMSAEDALLRLLQLQCENYSKMKLGQPISLEKGQGINPLMIICCAAMDLGWDMVIEDQSISENIRGISCGTDDYIKSNLVKKDVIEKLP